MEAGRPWCKSERPQVETVPDAERMIIGTGKKRLWEVERVL